MKNALKKSASLLMFAALGGTLLAVPALHADPRLGMDGSQLTAVLNQECWIVVGNEPLRGFVRTFDEETITLELTDGTTRTIARGDLQNISLVVGPTDGVELAPSPTFGAPTAFAPTATAPTAEAPAPWRGLTADFFSLRERPGGEGRWLVRCEAPTRGVRGRVARAPGGLSHRSWAAKPGPASCSGEWRPQTSA